jgi:hypothetical protein
MRETFEKHHNSKYGYIEPVVQEKDFVLGAARSAPFEVTNPSGDWRKGAPQGEPQRRGSFETSSCTNFGWLNLIETFAKVIFGLDWNKSERYVAVNSKQTPQGNDPKNPAEAIRLKGVIAEALLPFTDGMTWETYFAPNPMTKKFLREGDAWLDKYDFKYEYIFTQNTSITEKQRLLLQALQRSPVGVSVFAWVQDASGKYVKREGERDNHYTTLLYGEQGKPWVIYDSYAEDGSYFKELEWNYDFGIAQGFSLRKLAPGERQANLSLFAKILQGVVDFLKSLLAVRDKELDREKPPEIEPPKVSRITEWAKAIEEFENAPKEWFNPGAIKGLDGKFLKFPDYKAGFAYLCDYLTRACTGRHRAYPKAGETTLLEFTSIYAPSSDNNDPRGYCNYVSQKLGVSPLLPIKNLL